MDRIMGQLEKVAKSIRQMTEIEGIAAVPPSEAVKMAADQVPLSSPALDKSTAADAKLFQQAGWCFVAVANERRTGGQHKLFKGGDGRLMIESGRLNVKFDSKTGEKKIGAILQAHGLSIRRKYGFGGNLFRVESSHAASSPDAVELAKQLSENDLVIYAEPELIEAIPQRETR